MDLSIWPEDGGNEGGSASGGDRAANALSEALSSGEAYLLADDTNAVSAFLAQPGGTDTSRGEHRGGQRGVRADV